MFKTNTSNYKFLPCMQSICIIYTDLLQNVRHPSVVDQHRWQIKGSFLRSDVSLKIFPHFSPFWKKRQEEHFCTQKLLMSLHICADSIPGSRFPITLYSNCEMREIWRLGPRFAKWARQNDYKHTPISVFRLQIIATICLGERVAEEADEGDSADPMKGSECSG